MNYKNTPGAAFGLNPFYMHNSGDCTSCDADTELAPDPDHSGILHMYIRHDDDCPVLRAHQARTPS